jgi:hypothetical protein
LVPGTKFTFPTQNLSYSEAQGIEAVSFFACGKKDTSGKPGPATKVAGCAHLRMEMLYNHFLTAQARMGLMRPKQS